MVPPLPPALHCSWCDSSEAETSEPIGTAERNETGNFREAHRPDCARLTERAGSTPRSSCAPSAPTSSSSAAPGLRRSSSAASRPRWVTARKQNAEAERTLRCPHLSRRLRVSGAVRHRVRRGRRGIDGHDARARTHTLTLTRMQAHAHAPTHAHARTRNHAHARTQAHALAPTRMHAHACTSTTHARARTRTHSWIARMDRTHGSHLLARAHARRHSRADALAGDEACSPCQPLRNCSACSHIIARHGGGADRDRARSSTLRSLPVAEPARLQHATRSATRGVKGAT